MKYKLIIVDFNGVLSNSRFYNKYSGIHKNDISAIRNFLFDLPQLKLIESWMRGGLTYDQIHKIAIEKLQLAIPLEEANKILIESIDSFELNTSLIDLLMLAKTKGVKNVICSDNMDVFKFLIPKRSEFNICFDAIYSSAETKLLKEDNEGKIFDSILDLHSVSPDESLLVDDSKSVEKVIAKKNIDFFHFENYRYGAEELKRYLQL